MNKPNPFAPPKSAVGDVGKVDNGPKIDSLRVSDGWRRKFRLIDKAGGAQLPNLRALPRNERSDIGFNVLGFLFGPFYYVAKGMWRKAIAFFGAVIAIVYVLSIIMEMLGWGEVSKFAGYGASAIFAVRADIDYYKKMVLDDNGWW
jgi:hypothetical protein